ETPTGGYARSTSSFGSDKSSASLTLAVVIPIAPAAICKPVRKRDLCVFVCGRILIRTDVAYFASRSMFRRTVDASSTSAGVGARDRSIDCDIGTSRIECEEDA